MVLVHLRGNSSSSSSSKTFRLSTNKCNNNTRCSRCKCSINRFCNRPSDKHHHTRMCLITLFPLNNNNSHTTLFTMSLCKVICFH